MILDQATLGLSVVAAALYLKYRNDSFRASVVDSHPAILRNQTHASTTRNKGEWAVIRNRATPFPTKNHPQFVNSLHESLVKAFATASEKPAFQHKPIPSGPFVPVSVKQTATTTVEIGSGLIKLLGASGNNIPIGIFVDESDGVLDSIMLDFACVLFGFVSCWWSGENAIDQDSLKKVLSRTETRAIVVSESGIDSLLSAAGECKKLEHIIVAGAKVISKSHLERANALKVKICTLDSIRALGKERKHDFVKPEQTDSACILFEPNTNDVRGVVLSHSNVAVAISAIYVTLPQVEMISDRDVCLLRPSATSAFECCLVSALFISGAQVAISSSDAAFAGDVAALRPTLATSSAKNLSSLVSAVEKHPASKSWGFQHAKSVKSNELKEGRAWTGTWVDSLFLKNIQKDVLGGKLRCIWNIRGSAPTDATSVESIRALSGSQLFEVFARPEACGLVCATMYGDYSKISSNVGVPAANLEYKIVDAPADSYFVTDKPNPRGSVYIRGPAVTKAYFKEEQKTAGLVEREGWVMLSGVFGEVLPNGTLVLL
ncbi:hypothetical protein HDU98_009174 [Podochytrium sp. JEL0797]|nr:hypothetical protein HDU98_009174 [Podochytrium sp. JEL0797]